MPKLIVVAGPPGGGKSSAMGSPYFSRREIPYFNIDERCKALNGSARQIPLAVRQQANDELRTFCQTNMQTQRTFAFETTLRQDFAIRMAQEAKATGFDTDLHFIAAPVEVHIERVTGRALAGGHAASEPRLREMYAASMNNLPLAIAAFDYCSIYDSTQEDTLRIELRSGQIVMAKLPLPVWLPADLSLR